MGFSDNSRVHEEVYVGYSVESCIFMTYATIIYSNSRMHVGFLRETRVHIKKTHFKGISRHFQTLVSSRKF